MVSRVKPPQRVTKSPAIIQKQPKGKPSTRRLRRRLGGGMPPSGVRALRTAPGGAGA